jgi:endo-1,4-beta-xylanase
MKHLLIILLPLALLAAGCATTGATAKAEPGKMAAESVYSFGFETGTAGDWKPKGPVKLDVSDKIAHTGKYSLGASGRGDTWQDPEMDVLPLMKAVALYEVTCWVYIPKEAQQASVKMTVEIMANGVKNWVQICKPVEVEPGKWMQLAGQFDRQDGLEKASLYIEPLDPAVPFFIDDIAIAMQK